MTDPTMPAPLDLEALRKIAEAATPGPWSVWLHDDPRLRFVSDGQGNIADEVGPDDAAHIAAFDPQTVIALLDGLDAVTVERDAALENVRHSDMTGAENVSEKRVEDARSEARDLLRSAHIWLDTKGEPPAMAVEIVASHIESRYADGVREGLRIASGIAAVLPVENGDGTIVNDIKAERDAQILAAIAARIKEGT
jgi:hypothetical protein